MYSLEIREHLDKLFLKLSKKDPKQLEIVNRKVQDILAEPHRFKPLKRPLQNKRRVHVLGGTFVLIYSVDEREKVIILEHYGHHDEVYKLQ